MPARDPNCPHSMQDYYIEKETGIMGCNDCDDNRRLNNKKSIDRILTTDAKNILSIVACADDYGHSNQVFMHFAANMLGTLTQRECEEYAKEVSSQPGYTEEDYEHILECLTRFLKASFRNGVAK